MSNLMTAWTVVDPNWGEPRPLLFTMAESPEAAIELAVTDTRLGLYSGAREVYYDLISGKWEKLLAQGFRVEQVRIEMV